MNRESKKALSAEKMLNRRKSLYREYPRLWREMISEWSAPAASGSVWLTYSANYILNTGGIRWAVDPLTLHGRLAAKGELPPEPLPDEEIMKLEPLSFVILTHNHSDHLDLGLAGLLRNSRVKWVAPDRVGEKLIEKAGIEEKDILVPANGEKIEIDGIGITACEGLHFRKEPEKPFVPSNAYLVEARGKKLFFPGDTRTYDFDRIPFSGPLDWIFLHLWLGTNALDDEFPILYEFCRFALQFKPENIFLSHICDISKAPEGCWLDEHAETAASLLKKFSPQTKVTAPLPGQRTRL